eukprot:13406_1
MLYSPIQTISITNTLFLGNFQVPLPRGNGKIQLIANQTNSEIISLRFVNSIFSGPGGPNQPTIFLNETNGNKFVNVYNMIVKDIMLNRDGSPNNWKLQTTESEMVLTMKNSTKWIFNFTDVLLFGNDIGI